MSDPTPPPPRRVLKERSVEGFEQRVVFRGARWVYLAVAAAAVLVLVGGLVTGLYSVTPVVDLGEPESPELVDAEPVTQENVAETLQRLFADADQDEVYEYGEEDHADILASDGDDNADLDAAVAAVAAHFDEPGSYPWKDTSECARRGWRGSCYRWKKKRGARSVLMEALLLRSPLSDVESIGLAERLVLAAPANDDGRFVFLGLYKDLVLATGGQPEPVVAAVEQAVADSAWDDQALLELAVGLITAKTQDAGAAKVAALVQQTPRMREVFGTGGLQQALLRSWEATGDLDAEAATAARAVMYDAAAGVPGYQRQRVFDAWQLANAEAESEAEAVNSERMAAWRSEVADYEASLADAEANRTAAKATAVSGLGTGVAGICAVGVLLAVLGVERNTRRTEALLKALQQATSPAPVPALAAGANGLAPDDLEIDPSTDPGVGAAAL